MDSTTYFARYSSLTSFADKDELMNEAKHLENVDRGFFSQQRNSWVVPEIEEPYKSLVRVFDVDTKKARFTRKLFPEEDAIPRLFPMKDRDDVLSKPVTVEDYSVFKDQFYNVFCCNLLDYLNFDNVIVAGGSVLATILPIPEEYSSTALEKRKYYHDVAYCASDIDMFLYALTEEEANEKLVEIYEQVCRACPSEVVCFRSSHAVTMVSQYPYRHIQVVLRIYNSPYEVMAGFDIDSCTFCFDGDAVYCTPRGHNALCSLYNTIDLSRRSTSYEMRLAKYANRNFEVLVPGYKPELVDPNIFDKPWRMLQGLARLIVLEKLRTPNERLLYHRRQNPNKYPRYRDARTQEQLEKMGGSAEASDYSTVFLPWGRGTTAKKVLKLMKKKDILLNGPWFGRDRTYNLHPCFYGTAREVLTDMCPNDPPIPVDVDINSLKSYVRGPMTWLQDDPGRQQIGSFNPIEADNWEIGTYFNSTVSEVCRAVCANDTNVLTALLSKLPDVTFERDYLGRSPLHVGILSGSYEACKILLDSGVDPTLRLPDGRNALHLCAQYNTPAILKLVLGAIKKCEATSIKFESLSPEEKAKVDSPPRRISLLDTLNVKEKEDGQFTPVMYALRLAHIDCVKCLVEEGNAELLSDFVSVPSQPFRWHPISSGQVVLLHPVLLLGAYEIADEGILKEGITYCLSKLSPCRLLSGFNTILHVAIEFCCESFVLHLIDCIDKKECEQLCRTVNTSLELPSAVAVKAPNLTIAKRLFEVFPHLSPTDSTCATTRSKASRLLAELSSEDKEPDYQLQRSLTCLSTVSPSDFNILNQCEVALVNADGQEEGCFGDTKRRALEMLVWVLEVDSTAALTKEMCTSLLNAATKSDIPEPNQVAEAFVSKYEESKGQQSGYRAYVWKIFYLVANSADISSKEDLVKSRFVLSQLSKFFVDDKNKSLAGMLKSFCCWLVEFMSQEDADLDLKSVPMMPTQLEYTHPVVSEVLGVSETDDKRDTEALLFSSFSSIPSSVNSRGFYFMYRNAGQNKSLLPERSQRLCLLLYESLFNGGEGFEKTLQNCYREKDCEALLGCCDALGNSLLYFAISHCSSGVLKTVLDAMQREYSPLEMRKVERTETTPGKIDNFKLMESDDERSSEEEYSDDGVDHVPAYQYGTNSSQAEEDSARRKGNAYSDMLSVSNTKSSVSITMLLRHKCNVDEDLIFEHLPEAWVEELKLVNMKTEREKGRRRNKRFLGRSSRKTTFSLSVLELAIILGRYDHLEILLQFARRERSKNDILQSLSAELVSNDHAIELAIALDRVEALKLLLRYGCCSRAGLGNLAQSQKISASVFGEEKAASSTRPKYVPMETVMEKKEASTGPEKKTENADGVEPRLLELALFHGAVSIIEYLRAGDDVVVQLNKFVEYGDVSSKKLQMFLDKLDENFWELPYVKFLALKDKIEPVKVLANLIVGHFQTNSQERTPLFYAVSGGHVEGVELLRKETDCFQIDGASDAEGTAYPILLAAKASGPIEFFRYVLQCLMEKEDWEVILVNTVEKKSGRNVLQVALDVGKQNWVTGVVKELIRVCSSDTFFSLLLHKDSGNDGINAFMETMSSCNVALTKALYENFLSKDFVVRRCVSSVGNTLLHVALDEKFKEEDVVNFAFELVDDKEELVSVENFKGETALDKLLKSMSFFKQRDQNERTDLSRLEDFGLTRADEKRKRQIIPFEPVRNYVFENFKRDLENADIRYAYGYYGGRTYSSTPFEKAKEALLNMSKHDHVASSLGM